MKIEQTTATVSEFYGLKWAYSYLEISNNFHIGADIEMIAHHITITRLFINTADCSIMKNKDVSIIYDHDAGYDMDDLSSAIKELADEVIHDIICDRYASNLKLTNGDEVISNFYDQMIKAVKLLSKPL